MKIGNVKIKGKTALAPLAGVTDIPFRLQCNDFGADIVFSEMVSSEGLVRGSEKTNRYLKFLEVERPIALQLFGSDPDVMGEAAQIIEQRKPDFIDINFGCPVKKIVKNEAGSALLKNPRRMGEIVRKMVDSVKLPVTAKIRCGWDENSQPVSEIGKVLEDNGVSAIAIHARTRSQQFTGKANWDEIRKLKKAVNVPVLGNGDVKTPLDAQEMLSETGCDLVMIGRGAMGSPWVFRTINTFLETGDLLPDPSYYDRIGICIEQFKTSIDLYGSAYAVNSMKKHVALYLKGLPDCSAIKSDIFNSHNAGQMLEILINFQNFLKNNYPSGTSIEDHLN